MKSKRAMEYFRTQTPNQANLEYCAKNKKYNGTVLADAYKAIAIAEEDAEERAAKEFEKAKERIKAAIRLTFNGCLSSQLLERRMLIFEDLISEINMGE